MDGDLRKLFRTHIPEFHWQSIESATTGGGTPDANWGYAGREGWIEFKQTGAWKVGHMTPDQCGWHMRRAREYCRTHLAVRRWHDGGPRRGAAVDELWLYKGSAYPDVMENGLRVSDDVDLLLKHDGGPSRWDWSAIARVLRNT